MINSAEFTNRIEEVLKFYNLSASAFADTIGVQRSSISHLIAGRNKPSLEFVMKVVQAFPEVDLYWLINGKGSFPIKSEVPTTHQVPQNTPTLPMRGSTPSIDKIIIFYSDGSFKSYSGE